MRFRTSGAKWESSWVILWTGGKCILPLIAVKTVTRSTIADIFPGLRCILLRFCARLILIFFFALTFGSARTAAQTPDKQHTKAYQAGLTQCAGATCRLPATAFEKAVDSTLKTRRAEHAGPSIAATGRSG